ncbi:hypothetical protein XELAEV_18047203mg [Xenopus laevis]|uniref:Uncharacterized protein n=1 Tax=Xenopus laevis TaxID=8355 RepID=A0A974BUT7_XENLA|nr:hypothetical protein XELAEV_18047203mg [Xenopus laevis]
MRWRMSEDCKSPSFIALRSDAAVEMLLVPLRLLLHNLPRIILPYCHFPKLGLAVFCLQLYITFSTMYKATPLKYCL